MVYDTTAQDATAQDTTAQVATALGSTAHFVILCGRYGTPFIIDATEDSEKSSKHLPTPTSTSFRQSLIYLFGKDAAKLCKSYSQLTQKLASHVCQIILKHAEITTTLDMIFPRKKKTLDHTIRKIEGLLDPTYMTKTHHLNGQKSSLTHRQHIKTHRKKFADLMEESNSPFSPLMTV